jgi:formate/nitrite transporter FocA (FNT family)
VNEELRRSRLVKSIPSYLKKSITTIIRIFVVYKPFRFFLSLGLISIALGVLIGLRFLYYHFVTEESSGHVQSLILSSILFGFGFQMFVVAFLADLLAVNRRLLEDVQYRMRKTESGK